MELEFRQSDRLVGVLDGGAHSAS